MRFLSRIFWELVKPKDLASYFNHRQVPEWAEGETMAFWNKYGACDEGAKWAGRKSPYVINELIREYLPSVANSE